MADILIVYYSLGGNTKEAAEITVGAVEAGGHRAVLKTGLEAGIEDLLSCEGLAIGTPDYFSYMAGGLKDFFDRTLYPARGKADGKPYFAFVTHGGGGKAVESVEKIAGSFKFKKASGPVLIKDRPDAEDAESLRKATGELLSSVAGR